MKNKGSENKEIILWKLRERIKELTALHKASAILQNERKNDDRILKEFVSIIPPAWQYPGETAARITAGDLVIATRNFKPGRWKLSASFGMGGNRKGKIDIFYLAPKKAAFEGPFLKEERQLIDSLAKLLEVFFQKRIARKAIDDAMSQLEDKVVKRTASLNDANIQLREEIAERKRSEQKVKNYQQKLKRLASELTLTEERERRIIASDLHDHIGQSLAVIRMKLKTLEGNAVFSGAERDIEDIRILLEQTIRYTRNLTFELSPPVLYDLGIEAGLEWLAEQFRKKYGMRVGLNIEGPKLEISNDLVVTLFRSVRELMYNVIKHARAGNIVINLTNSGGRMIIEVVDDGIGFGASKNEDANDETGNFGLFSIKEQLGCFGGKLTLNSTVGQGTRAVIECPAKGKGC